MGVGSQRATFCCSNIYGSRVRGQLRQSDEPSLRLEVEFLPCPLLRRGQGMGSVAMLIIA